ncbi:MAG: MBL fold metallo-hydrolase [Lachnospiraceae bacterium]|nr:MBL fold metallo-hydrolase [Lachnospiraceae bacterium]
MKRLILLMLIALVLLSGCEDKKPTPTEEPPVPVKEVLEIHVISLGKADGILLICDGETMLIDAGLTEHGSVITEYLKNHNVTKLNYAVVTHGDKDHVGGMAEILKNFPVGKMILSPKKENSPEYVSMTKAVNDTNTPWEYATLLTEYKLGGAKLTVLAPGKKALEKGDDNDSSIVFRLEYKGRTALLMGDALTRTEKEMRDNGYTLKAEVIKIGHHGKNDATTKKFIKEVAPQYAVITCSSEEPAEADALNVLRAFSVEVYRTDERGTVTFFTDGTKWEVGTER